MPRAVLAELSVLVVLAAGPLGAGCERRGHGVAGNPRVVVLGFDGIDPRLVERFRAAGKLPNVDRLADQGSLRAIGTTTPPVSSSAWTTFATGLPPSRHGVIGLVGRDPRTYRIVDAAQSIRAPELLLGFPVRGPEVRSRRRGTSFWERADRGGSRSVVLRVPYAFPPTPLGDGRSLSGVGVPDVRLQASGYGLVTSAPDGEVAAEIPASWDGHSGHAAIAGLRIDDRRGEGVELTFKRAAERLRVVVDGRSVLLEPGEWSEPVGVRFPVSVFLRVSATVRFLLESLDPLRVYVSAPNVDPREPYVPLSWPAGFAGELADRVGDFETLGWAEPTAAYDDGAIDAEAFLHHVALSLDWMRRAVLHEIDQRDAALVVAVFTEPDRVSHMFYREMADGVIEHVYRAMDRLIEDVLRHLPASARLLIVSDHGFEPFAWQVSLNAWLEREGLQARRGRSHGLDDIDWSRTQAYALGLGQVYLNLEGREGHGRVRPGSESQALLRRIETGLAAVTSPADGLPVVAATVRGAEEFAGPFVGRAPDLLVQFRPGYRSAFADGLGGAADRVVSPNDRRWSGDHGGARARDVPGVLISNQELLPGAVSLSDIAPTVLAWLGQPVPSDLPGRALGVAPARSAGGADPAGSDRR